VPLIIYHLLQETERVLGRPVTRAEVEAHAREVVPIAERNVLPGLNRLAATHLADRSTAGNGEVWHASGNGSLEALATRHPDIYRESFWYFLISQKLAGRPLPPAEVVAILREVAGESQKLPAVADILRHLDERRG
jgi:hypothetical protein